MVEVRFSEFTEIPLGQKMKVVGLLGGINTISEEATYLLSETEIVKVKGDIGVLDTKTASLDNRVGILENTDAGDVTQEDIDALKLADTEIKASVLENTNSISAVHSDLLSEVSNRTLADSALDAKIVLTNASVDALDARVVTNTSGITNLVAKDVVHGAGIQDNKDALDAQSTKITGIEQNIITINSKDAQQDTAITGINQSILDIVAKNTQQDTDISKANQDITDIKSMNTQQDGKITTLEGTSTTQGNKITAIETKNTQQDTSITNLENTRITIDKVPTRKKSEVTYTGLNLVLTSNTDYNLVTLLKALTPASGTLAPFFNTTSNKLNAYADDTTLLFKLNLVGSWAGAQTNRSMQIDFAGTTGNRITKSRDEATTGDTISLGTFLSIDATGFIVNNGTAMTLRSNGANFTITQAILVAEQVTTLTTISIK